MNPNYRIYSFNEKIKVPTPKKVLLNEFSRRKNLNIIKQVCEENGLNFEVKGTIPESKVEKKIIYDIIDKSKELKKEAKLYLTYCTFRKKDLFLLFNGYWYFQMECFTSGFENKTRGLINMIRNNGKDCNECSICYNQSEKFFSCHSCGNKYCMECGLETIKCPFCRAINNVNLPCAYMGIF